MARSTGTAPKGGYNSICFDYFGPMTAGATVTGYDDPSAGTGWIALNHTTHSILHDKVEEYTAAAGVTIDTSAGIGTQIKDGGVRLQNNVSLKARNAANSGDVGLIYLDASNVGQLDTTAFAKRSYAATVTAGCTCSGSMTISAVSVTSANYLFLGPLVIYELNINFTLGGTPSTTVNVPLPVAAASATSWNVVSITQPVLSSQRIGLAYANGSNLEVIQDDQASNWGVGASQTIQGHVIYWR